MKCLYDFVIEILFYFQTKAFLDNYNLKNIWWTLNMLLNTKRDNKRKKIINMIMDKVYDVKKEILNRDRERNNNSYDWWWDVIER